MTDETEVKLMSLFDRKKALLSEQCLLINATPIENREKNKKMKDRKKMKLAQQLHNRPSLLPSTSCKSDASHSRIKEDCSMVSLAETCNIDLATEELTSPIDWETERVEIEKEREKLITSHVPRAIVPFDFRLIVAPMVNQSDPPFRTLCLKYGASCAYTEMLYSTKIAYSKTYLRNRLQEVDHDYFVNHNRFEDSVYNLNKPENIMSNTHGNTDTNAISYISNNHNNYQDEDNDNKIANPTSIEECCQNKNSRCNGWNDKNTMGQSKKKRNDENTNTGYKSRPLVVQICGNDPKILSDCMLKLMEHNNRISDQNCILSSNPCNDGNVDSNTGNIFNYCNSQGDSHTCSDSVRDSGDNNYKNKNCRSSTEDSCLIDAIDFNLGCPQDRAKEGSKP